MSVEIRQEWQNLRVRFTHDWRDPGDVSIYVGTNVWVNGKNTSTQNPLPNLPVVLPGESIEFTLSKKDQLDPGCILVWGRRIQSGDSIRLGMIGTKLDGSAHIYPLLPDSTDWSNVIEWKTIAVPMWAWFAGIGLVALLLAQKGA